MDYLENEPASQPDDTKPRPAVDDGAAEPASPVEISEPAPAPDDTPTRVSPDHSRAEPNEPIEPIEPIHEPAPAPDDTPTRVSPDYSHAEPIEPFERLHEPARAPGDTEPGAAVVTPDEEYVEAGRGGCGNTALVGTVLLAFVFLCVAAVALAAYAGWRDGSAQFQSHQSEALAGTISAQATLAHDDCANSRYELCQVRCAYIATQQPFYPGMGACISQAQLALSATPSPGPSETATPAPPTPTPTLGASAAATNASGFSPEDLFAHAQSAIDHIDYETAMQYLEALRGLDANYKRAQVEDMLVQTYEALGTQYKNQGRLSEMVVVIQKALAIQPLSDTDWAFVINATQLYLDAKGYLVAGDMKNADTVYNRLMGIAPTYLDTKTLACQAFSSAGDKAALQTYKCP